MGLVEGASGRRGVEAEDADVVEQRGVVALDRHDVVAAAADDQSRGLRAALQGVEGDGAPGDAEFAQQAARSDDLAAGAVRGGLAVHHAAAVLDGGDHHARRIAAARAVQGPGLAVERERPAGRAPGRREAPHGGVQRIGVQFREDAVDAGLRRRHQPLGERTAERAHRGELALGKPGGELRDRGDAPGAGELGRHGDRQHGRQPVPDAARRAVLGHLAQEVVQAAQPVLGGRLGTAAPGAPRRRLVESGKRRPRVARQRPREHPLRRPVRRPAAADAGVAPRLAQRGPVRRQVARALEPRRVHEGLRDQHRMAARRFHVRRQPAQRQRQHSRRQVAAMQPRQDQEARVVRHQMQPPELLLRRPADPGVPRLHLERTPRPPDQRHPTPVRRLRDVPQPAAEQAPESQVVVRVHQTVPLRPLRSAPDAPTPPTTPPCSLSAACP